MTLNQLKVGQTATVKQVDCSAQIRQHFLDMGVIPGADIKLIKLAPMGDPVEIKIHDYSLTLRLADAAQISIKDIRTEVEEEVRVEKIRKPLSIKVPHPGLGEFNREHRESNPTPLSEDERLTFALAGNQNCGKTTLFNQLTGANQHVGNFPGVTVEGKSGVIKGHPNTSVVDLPGIYSLSPYSSEEIVSREFILKERPKGIINIVDATNIERNLYLTMQLMEQDVPMVLALNMMDEVKGNGGHIHINMMEEALGIPVVPISAAKNEGIRELVDHAIHVAKFHEAPSRMDFCAPEDNGGAVHRTIHAVMHLIENKAKEAGLPKRFAATKAIEGDRSVIEALQLTEAESTALENMIEQMENERGLDRAAAIADMRFSFIQRLVKECVVKPRESKERKRSQAIDKILTGRYTALPCFILIMALIFFLTFNVIGGTLQDLLTVAIDKLEALTELALTKANVSPILSSLIIDGIINGVGSVISFLPIIVILFFFLSLLEDTGYMARIAFVMDKPLRRLGLSGRSIVPLLLGFGCSVPAVMSSRTLPSERDRKLTILMIPFMSCTAKLPIYGYFATIFFPHYSGLVMILLYLLGIVVGILFAMVSKKTAFKGEAVPFVMELPNYRMPGAKNVAQLLWEKAKDFIERAFSIILLASIIIWILTTFSFSLRVVTDSQNSILATLAGIISPIFKPLGFADWRITSSLISGFMAKESVVSSVTVLFGNATNLLGVLNQASALSLLVFCLLYTPCVAAIASVRRELGGRWALLMIALQCSIAWLVALFVHLIAVLII